MKEAESIVFIIDDDPLYRASTERLLRSVGFTVQSFQSARDFVGSRRPNVPSCLILDVRLPGLSGLDLQRELAEAGVHIPIIFVTGHGDIPMSVQAMKAGAVEFLTKPFRDQALLDAIRQAIGRDQIARRQHARNADLRSANEELSEKNRDLVDALSHLQLRALEALRAGIADDDERERTQRLLLLTVNGVAAGLQNTG